VEEQIENGKRINSGEKPRESMSLIPNVSSSSGERIEVGDREEESEELEQGKGRTTRDSTKLLRKR
jgi:hypothetical protein